MGERVGEKDFAIVCDETCDLPLAFLEKIGVERVDVGTGAGSVGAAEALVGAYRRLAASGCSGAVSIHSATAFSPLIDDARLAARSCEGVIDVAVVDSGAASVATGMLVDRAAHGRELGLCQSEVVESLARLVERLRLLVIPASTTRLPARRTLRKRELIGRAGESLRMRLTGERCLYLMAGGSVVQLARNNSADALVERLVHAVDVVAQGAGPLVSATMTGRDARRVPRELARARSLGSVCASALTEAILGHGAIAVGLLPEHDYELVNAGA